MLNFNLKKKLFSLIKNFKSKETGQQSLKHLDLKINYKKKKNNLFVNIEILEQKKLDFQKIAKELEQEISEKLKIKQVNIAISQKKESQEKTPKLILICSAKGGVGKSTICVNLAVAASKLGKKVGIIDADIYGPSTAHLLGVKQTPRIHKNKMQPIEKHGVKLNSMALIAPKDKALIWRGPMLSKTLNNLLYQTNWDDTKYLFIDLPPGTGDVYLSLLKNFDNAEAILVTTPQKIALLDVARSVDMLKTLNIKITGLIENMAIQDKEIKQNSKKFAKKHKLKLLESIPYHKEIITSSEKSKPYQTNKEINKKYQKILEEIF